MLGRRDFVIIGFTGPIGAGCTTAAKFFSNQEELDRIIKGLISDENLIQQNKKIYKSYREIMLASDQGESQKSKELLKQLKDNLKKREFLKVLKKHYKEFRHKFRIKYFSFSEILLQELIESILFGEFKAKIEKFPDDYCDKCRKILSFLEKEAYNLLKKLEIKKEKIKEHWEKIIEKKFREIVENKNECKKFERYVEETFLLFKKLEEFYDKSNYIEFLQDMGTFIRVKGSILYNMIRSESEKPHPVYSLSYRINLLIKFFRHLPNERKYSRFVIEAFRNPFEIDFFRQRYYEFYLFSLFAPFEVRQRRCSHIRNLKDRDKIDQGFDSLEKKEQEKLREKFKGILKEIICCDNKSKVDQLLAISMQNTQRCVYLSDININNYHIDNDTDCKEKLFDILLLYYTLILQPGFVPPSADETFMNMAYMLSLRSTCISRQVGAIITGESGYIVGAGWNDVSEGQIGCGLRWRTDCKELDNEILPLHPSFEEEFRRKIVNNDSDDTNLLEESFCFKDEYANFEEKSNTLQYCRALHAEENAILQTAKIGGIGLKNATVYTTTFPCELCAKKIYQVGIERVVYVEPYPKSISEEVFFKDGIRKPQIEQFEGVKPYSYFRLYKPFLDKKDWQDYLKNGAIRKLLLS